MIKHGEARNGACSTEYNTWVNIIKRCCRPSCRLYKNYGGRGIKVCDRWRNSYQAFLQDVGRKPTPSHSLDRINNNGNYEPGNVRWATQIEQHNNKRSNHFVEIGGVRRTLAEWSRSSGISHSLITMRISRGWSEIRAITTQPTK